MELLVIETVALLLYVTAYLACHATVNGVLNIGQRVASRVRVLLRRT